MSATRRVPDHRCTTFVTVKDVLLALATREDPRSRHVNIFARNLTARVFKALEKSDATHRCTVCKRWVSVTPAHFRTAATHADLTRITKAEARQLAERPIVFTVSPHCDGSDAPYLAKLPGYGFDVRHPQTQEIRGKGAQAWRYTFKGRDIVKFARNAR